MIEIEKYQCLDRNEACARERHFYETLNSTLNMVRPILTDTERTNYYQDNKNKFEEYQTQYREENKTKIAEYQKHYREANQNKLLENQITPASNTEEIII
jgi:uncharacterized membrane protein (DUF106 family)